MTSDDNRYGWIMVGVTFGLTALAFGGLAGVSVFIKPIAAEFGWSRGEVSFGYTAIALSSAVAGLFWGYAADRIGTRPRALIATGTMAGALVLLSRLDALWQFYAFYFIFGALGHGALSAPLYAAGGFWFSRNKGLAMGLMAAGGAVGQGVVPFLAAMLIVVYDWRTAYLVMGIAYVVCALPLALLVRDPPARIMARQSPATGRSASQDDDSPVPLRPPVVLAWISVAVIFCCVCMAVPIVHVVPMLTDRGIAPQTAAGVLFTLMLAGAAGRILGGKLADIVGALPAYMMMSLGQTVVVVWFAYLDWMPGIWALAVLFGLFFSGVMVSILNCVRVMIPARLSGRAMAIVSLFGWAGMGLGGVQGGVLFDLTGDYRWSYNTAVIAGAINLGILSAFYLHLRRRTMVAEA
ncbi:MAG: MFS transporter [Alphaproteobacteria bacterium]